jgi:hypothetical protein
MEGRPSKQTKNKNKKLKKPWIALTSHESLIHNSSNSILDDPKSYKKAMEKPHAQEWKQFINTEFNSTKNNTWSLLQLPSNRSPVGYKWVFKTKQGPNNEILK